MFAIRLQKEPHEEGPNCITATHHRDFQCSWLRSWPFSFVAEILLTTQVTDYVAVCSVWIWTFVGAVFCLGAFSLEKGYLLVLFNNFINTTRILIHTAVFYCVLTQPTRWWFAEFASIVFKNATVALKTWSWNWKEEKQDVDDKKRMARIGISVLFLRGRLLGLSPWVKKIGKWYLHAFFQS